MREDAIIGISSCCVETILIICKEGDCCTVVVNSVIVLSVGKPSNCEGRSGAAIEEIGAMITCIGAVAVVLIPAYEEGEVRGLDAIRSICVVFESADIKVFARILVERRKNNGLHPSFREDEAFAAFEGVRDGNSRTVIESIAINQRRGAVDM